MTALKVAVDISCIGAAFAGDFDWMSAALLTLAVPSLLWTAWAAITSQGER